MIHFWSDQKRSDTLQTLQKAISRQILIASIKQNLNDIQKHVALLSGVIVEAGAGGAGPDEIARFNNQIRVVSKQIQELEGLSGPGGETIVKSLQESYRELGPSWKIFYENFGVHQAKAITELAIRADPLSQRMIHQLIPQLEEDEKRRVRLASANHSEVTALVKRMTIFIFAFSTLLAVLVSYLVSRRLTRGLGDLTQGIAMISSGDLEHRIAIHARDELGNLAQVFNNMSSSLLSARTQLTEAHRELEQRHRDVEKQRKLSDSLLLNILPSAVARELQDKGAVDPRYYEDVTIFFADFVGFTSFTEKLAAEDLVNRLHNHFTAFDRIVERYSLEKLKTVGDSYMCVGGMPARNSSHPVDAVMAAFEMVREIAEYCPPENQNRWTVRIGIHTGPVIAGVVGVQKFAYDIWGESVNFASRMESSGEPNRINLSRLTYSRVKDFFECEYRGKVATKEKRAFDMYFATGILKTLTEDLSQMPPPAFLRRYHIYFQKEPSAFPDFLVKPD